MEKIDKTLDQVLARAALNLTKLEQIHEVRSGNKHTHTHQRKFETQIKCAGSDLQTLATGREEQIERERVWLEREIQKMVDKASQAVENW